MRKGTSDKLSNFKIGLHNNVFTSTLCLPRAAMTFSQSYFINMLRNITWRYVNTLRAAICKLNVQQQFPIAQVLWQPLTFQGAAINLCLLQDNTKLSMILPEAIIHRTLQNTATQNKNSTKMIFLPFTLGPSYMRSRL